MKLPESIKIILDDNLSGSITLLKRLMVALENELLDPEVDGSVFIGYIEFIRSRMEMFTVIRHFCDELILSHNVSAKHFPKNYLDFIAEYKEFWEKVPPQILNNLRKVTELKGKTVMLHSNSGTLREIFRIHAEDSTHVKIFQTLSAPAEEGRIQAHDLANMGYDVTLIADALSAEKMKQTQLLLLGADQIRKKTIINKIGSFQMVLAAQEYNIPVIVVTESRKLLQSDEEGSFKDKKRNPDEILKEIRHPHLTGENYYFEEVPKYYVSRIITEQSVIEGEAEVR